jgi:hypothetical protein
MAKIIALAAALLGALSGIAMTAWFDGRYISDGNMSPPFALTTGVTCVLLLWMGVGAYLQSTRPYGRWVLWSSCLLLAAWAFVLLWLWLIVPVVLGIFAGIVAKVSGPRDPSLRVA